MDSFKVICVTLPKEWKFWKLHKGYDHPDVGNECEVIKSTPHPLTGHLMYTLKGYTNAIYGSRNFATLPGLTAEEMAEPERESIIK